MLTRLMFLQALVGVVRVPVFACALALLIGTVAVSGAGILLREGLRAWATFWTGGYKGAGASDHRRRGLGPIGPGDSARHEA